MGASRSCPNLQVDLGEALDKIKDELRNELASEIRSSSRPSKSKVTRGDLRQISLRTKSVVVSRDEACPAGLSEGEVPFDELTPTLQNFVRETGMNAPVKQCARVGRLGMIKFVPTTFDGTKFALGLLTLPNLFALATRLSEANVLLPRMNRAAASGGLVAATLVTHLVTGGKSFLLGAFVGQLPSFFDALAVEVIGAMGAAPVALKGLGATAEEQELAKLRNELERLGAVDSAEGGAELPGEGLVPAALRGTMVVR